MKKIFLVLGGILCSLCTQAQEFTVNSSAYSAGNRATAYSMQNRIVTVKRNGVLYTYFAYYDLGTVSGTDFAKIAEYNNATGSRSVISVGTIVDGDTPDKNHGSPTIELDPSGDLHVVFGAHNSVMYYRKSVDKLFNSSLALGGTLALNSVPPRWTYPVIKSDNSSNLHLAGSLDSEGNGARAFGYRLRSASSSGWSGLLSNDPLKLFRSQTIAENALCRYNVIMNIDDNGNIHALAPAQDSDTESDNYGHLQYYHYVYPNGGNKFEYKSHAYQNDENRYEEGFANIEFDPENRPHFLISIRDLPDSLPGTNTPPLGWEKWIKHFYFNGSNWIPEDIKFNGFHIQNAAFRIDKDGMMYILLQRNTYFGEGQNPSQILLASKSVYNTSNSWACKLITVTDGLYWQPSIEADEDKHLNKNWFYGMWQSGQGGYHGGGQNVIARKIIPCDAVIQNRTFSTYTEYHAGNEIKVGFDIKPNAPTGNVLFTSSSNTNFKATNKIVFSKGFKVAPGATFSAQISNIVCDVTSEGCTTSSQGGGAARLPSGESEYLRQESISNEHLAFTIYPNPSTGTISVAGGNGEGFMTLTIYNTVGTKLYNEKIQLNGHFEITRTIDFLSNGIYIIEVQKENKRFLRKLMVSR